MKKIISLVLALTMFVSFSAFADEAVLKLPEPEKSGGMSLLEALSLRRTEREFSDDELNIQQLSNLLWAAAGKNRENGLRVYPVAMGVQDIFIYVFNREGIYKYDALENTLTLIEAGDFRAETGMGSFVANASVNLAYVQDLNLWKDQKVPQELVPTWGFAHAGAVMQNAYLYAASQGWNAVIRGSFDSEKLSKLMKLKDGEVIKLIHSIGPKD